MWWKEIDLNRVGSGTNKTNLKYKKKNKIKTNVKIALIFRLKWKRFIEEKKNICIIFNGVGQYFMLFEFNVMISA